MGSSAVCNIVTEACESIFEVLWKDHVDKHFPKNADAYKKLLIMFHSPFCFGAFDGFDTLIKCMAGGLEENKEYHSF